MCLYIEKGLMLLIYLHLWPIPSCPPHMLRNPWGKLFWAFCAHTVGFLIGLRGLKQYFTQICYLKLDTRPDPLPLEIFRELLMSSLYYRNWLIEYQTNTDPVSTCPLGLCLLYCPLGHGDFKVKDFLEQTFVSVDL